MSVLLQVDFPFAGPWGEAMTEALRGLAESIANEPGLIWKIWTENPATAEAGWIVNHMRQNAVLASTDGPMDNVLKFKPPMVFGQREADILCAALETAFADLAARPIARP